MNDIMCAAIQRIGRLKGEPCPCRASRVVSGLPLCGTHARLHPDVRRKAPAVGFVQGHKTRVVVAFDRPAFERVREMAEDRGSSFGAMTRRLVDYALEETSWLSGSNYGPKEAA